MREGETDVYTLIISQIVDRSASNFVGASFSSPLRACACCSSNGDWKVNSSRNRDIHPCNVAFSSKAAGISWEESDKNSSQITATMSMMVGNAAAF